MDALPVWGESRRRPSVPGAAQARAHEIHRDVVAGTRLLRTVWPQAAFVDFEPGGPGGHVTFEALSDDQGRSLLDYSGLTALLALEAQMRPGRAGDDCAVGAEAIFRLKSAVTAWRKTQQQRVPSGATWQVRDGRIRNGSGIWVQCLVQLVLPAQDGPRHPEAAPGADAVGRPL